ncbi:GNAT family N-acetyltransferase [Trichococcus ilyis]|uniref:Acyl-coa n-acyltransferase n=1 Tax=Trichococcus ilyis TaxID=640938 RepID=A0A143YRC3_9LACT|nr:GNAT family N-acetyltransferase [Trichococcus ilyis]CZQ96904.1 acyl-coa n-acyltransferase [Trichococcus ilyis]SEJ53138.1 ElaA protein [Trichococcus ilyis]
MWHIKTIGEMNSLEFYKILRLRIDTFVCEQQRIYHELDDNDLNAFHVYYTNDRTGETEGYARVFKAAGHVTFGRVVTSVDARGTGLGSRLIEAVLVLCKEQWPNEEIIIESQEQVVGLYQKFGFHTFGDTFTFEGTPHVEMRYTHGEDKKND